MTVRTRIAPSPTGVPHVGTAYVALFNKAFAEKHGGKFVLRIEDSDQARNSAESERQITETLRWLELAWDEGPDVGGDFGPYRTSERLPIYRKFLDQLLEKGGAFHCFCSPERLAEMRVEQQKAGAMPGYDGLCLSLNASEVQVKLDAGEDFVIRLKVPREGDCELNDGIRGRIEIPWNQVDMQVLLKSDGFPTYHLCATVDDHEMGITHVLRGEEWINSCPKHLLICQYLDWDYPAVYHLPLLRNPDQSKLSKRKNPTGVNYFRDRGYLPEALLNYLALMGWSMPDEREMFGYADLVQHIDLKRMTTRGPVFDLEKLDWLNGKYLRELSTERYKTEFAKWAMRHNKLDLTIPLVKERAERFDQVLARVDYLFGDRLKVEVESFTHKSLTVDQCIEILDYAIRVVDGVSEWKSNIIHQAFNSLAEAMGMRIRDVLFPLFVAISGRRVALPLFDSIELLGLEMTRSRMRSAIEILGGISKKKKKLLDKSWEALRFPS